jgi:general secretion pathway protein K
MKRQRGIALLGVLWAGIILALLAGGVTDISRGDIELARNQLESARAELAAEAAAEIAMLGIINGGEDAIQEDGAIHAWAFDGTEVRVQAMPEDSRVDLNNADEEILAKLFAAAGAEEDEAAAIAQAVLDFRDTDDLPMDRGAEDADYEAAGYFLGAKDAPFENVQELAGVMGVSAELYRRAAPGLTVHGGRGGQIEPMPAIVAEAFGEGLKAPRPAPEPPFSAELAETPERIAEPLIAEAGRSRLIHIHAEAVTKSGAVYALDIVAQQQRSASKAYRIVNRRRGEVELFDLTGAEERE